ncbi:S-adenosyl-L-methionine-dependent methyltransferase [Aspergillus avenaceus]|uniref:tRNA wybutosine-synthesizing protein 2 n=1 Tax=Aspergillus avenaceus TaxID=36643 RepID=A0A5N6TSF7_ASPAV|nr:S-adenosyl-L-methionine-dependent methyltransferase [Aspergillus avenaceus]
MDQKPTSTDHQHKRKRPARVLNPLQRGIQDFVTKNLSEDSLSKYGLSPGTLLSNLPKKFTVYEPMLLLPVNALSSPSSWSALYKDLNNEQRQALYASMVGAFSRMGVTHVAINAPIALTDVQGQENRMRSPAGLVPLYGDFGPAVSADGQPTGEDLQQAFWVHTMQNHGITQVWAPLHTMFSRGNITEKARVLGQGSTFEGLDELSLGGDRLDEISVVDMYAGIGYFVFSYLKRGVKRVWGWEINGWSVEGLRRGCLANGWDCTVVRIADDGTLSVSISDLVQNLRDTDRVVLFHGDNRFAADILKEIRALVESRGTWSGVRHVNLGLLPSSSAAWDNACQMVDIQKGGWIHVHENVDVREIEKMKDDITLELGRLRSRTVDIQGEARSFTECRHVEQVKTYAPGVIHCVYDMKLFSDYELRQKTVE